MFKVFAAAFIALFPALIILALYEALGFSFQGDMNKTMMGIYAVSFVGSYIAILLFSKRVEANDN